MRKHLMATLPFALMIAAPAMAQVSPSPCDRPLRTGRELPRQDTARSGTFLTAEPNPSWRSAKIARVLRDEPVTVLQECGMRLRVRTVRGEEGWIATVMLPSELRLMEEARRRPPASAADCAEHFWTNAWCSAARASWPTVRPSRTSGALRHGSPPARSPLTSRGGP